MGSGKSTVGKLLAKKLNYTFIDLDQWIEKEEKNTISSIFTERGETAFRELESRYLHQLSILEKIVISTGGGTPCFHHNLEEMNKQGLTIYLQMPAAALYDRLKKNSDSRPLLKGLKGEELLHFIQHKLAEREVFYSQAKMLVSGISLDVKKLAESIK